MKKVKFIALLIIFIPLILLAAYFITKNYSIQIQKKYQNIPEMASSITSDTKTKSEDNYDENLENSKDKVNNLKRTDTNKEDSSHETSKKADSDPAMKNPGSEDTLNIPSEVSAKANSIANRNVEMSDYVRIAQIILGKLSFGDIKYLFDQAEDDYWVNTPIEEIKKAREILFTKLSAQDLETLRAIGKKYGRSMEIIKPSIDIEKTKAKQIEAKKAKSK